MQSIDLHDQIQLAPPPLSASGATLLQDVSNSTLVAELCRSRAEISIALDGSTVLLAECLMPLERLWPHNGLPDSIVVRTVPVDNNIHQFAATKVEFETSCNRVAPLADKGGGTSLIWSCGSIDCTEPTMHVGSQPFEIAPTGFSPLLSVCFN